jgi:DNA-binding response OmpR family regulator
LQKVTFPKPEERAPSILIVEGDTLMRAALSDYLQECGFKVLEAVSGDEAKIIVERSEVKIDLVFSETQLPGTLDGFGLANWVRSHRQGLPVLLTASDAKKTDTAKELCENEPFMAKPYDLKVAVAQIRSTLEGGKT